MAKVTVEYKRSNTAGITAIILHFNCSNGRLKYYTGESSEPGKLTKKAEQMKTFIEVIAATYRIASAELNKETLREKLDEQFSRGNNRSSLIVQMDRVIEKMKAGEITTPGKKNRYAPKTIKGLRHTIRLLEAFGARTVTLKTYDEFIVWCQKKHYSLNYIGTQIKNWKTLGKAVGGNPVYDHPDFKILTEETYDISLTEKEIDAIYKLKLSDQLSITRDWFIIDCFTGLRISDLTLLSEANVNKGFITIANEKTDVKVTIPMNRYVREIRKKYDGFPPKISDQKLNKNIKTIAKAAKLTDTVLYSITKGGKRVDEYIPKWQMVSNHTSRRSFITNLLKRGESETLVMKLAGIKSHATMQRYNKMTAEDAAHVMSKRAFFK